MRVRPVTAGAAGAALLALLALWPEAAPPGAAISGGPAELAEAIPGSVAEPEPVIFVQFVLSAENARSVALAGDFNEWDTSQTLLRDADGDGTWTGLVALRPGMHKYMFVVNGERWMPDPRAERYVDDGFGMRNSLIAVTPPQSSAL